MEVVLNTFSKLCWSVLLGSMVSTAFAQDDFVVPISANSPHVFMGITPERDPDDASFFSVPNSPPRQEFLPEDGSSHFEVAVFDTGSPATIISHDSFLEFGIAQVGRQGINITPLGGAGGGVVDAINSDPVGVYAIGLDGLLTRVLPSGEVQSVVNTNEMRGTFNDSVLYGDAGTEIPNLIGTTTASHYTTRIDYSDPQIIEYNGETHRSPAVQLTDLGDFGARPSRRIQMNMKNGALGLPAFLPDLAGIANNIDDLSDNPSTPTIAGSFWLTLNVENNGVRRDRLEAIFDTGAQGSIVSEQVAAEMGFDVERDEPDFLVRLAGVTGESEEVKGFYADEVVIPGTDGGLVLKDVPLIVFNLQDPSSESGNTLDALIGMNLFANRDLILNPEPGNAFLGVSDPSVNQHDWSATTDSARWGDFRSWSAPGIPAIDWYTNVRNNTGTPQIALVDEDSTVGSFVSAGSEDAPDGTMTTVIAEGKTLTLFASAILLEGSTIHLEEGAKLAPLAVEVRGGTISGTGTVEGEVLSQGTLIPGGVDSIGTLIFPGSLDQLSRGTMRFEIGDNSDPQNIQYDQVMVEGAISVGGRLEISTTDDYMELGSGERELLTIITAERGILEEFSALSFNDVELTDRYRVSTDRSSFRDHVEDGQFVTLSYPARESVAIENYQAEAGDVDGNGVVEFEDFIILSTNFNTEQDWTGGDFTGDGVVTFGDFLQLSTNYQGISGNAQSVPEPNASMLICVGFVVALGARRRRSR